MATSARTEAGSLMSGTMLRSASRRAPRRAGAVSRMASTPTAWSANTPIRTR
jgi:hypothetical protein